MRSKRNAKTRSQLGKGCHSGSPASSEHIGARTVAHAFVYRELLQEEEKKVEDTERMGLMHGTHVFKHRDHLNIAHGKVFRGYSKTSQKLRHGRNGMSAPCSHPTQRVWKRRGLNAVGLSSIALMGGRASV